MNLNTTFQSATIREKHFSAVIIERPTYLEHFDLSALSLRSNNFIVITQQTQKIKIARTTLMIAHLYFSLANHFLV